jgi:hypothetical protein
MRDPSVRRRERALVRIFGSAVVGGALAAAVVGALAGMPLLAGVALVIAAEETLEFSVVAGALRIERAPTWKMPVMRLRLGAIR